MLALIRFAAAVALVAAGSTWLLNVTTLPAALLLTVIVGWMVFDLVQP